MAGEGDRLASGRSASATWGPLDVSQSKWDEAFGAPEPAPKKKRRKRKKARPNG